jgi:hypothetical protein
MTAKGGFPRFTGNCPSNVSKDAKYTVRDKKGETVVALHYRTPDGEQWLATTREHPELVEMVNAVKLAHRSAPKGAFYINEYKQVIVPIEAGDYYLAGEYTTPLEFVFEGNILSGDAKDFKGRPLKSGDEWFGPHPGIPYRLKAGGKDIYYTAQIREDVTKKVILSAYCGIEETRLFAQRFLAVKGFQGGRIYVNEFRQIFTPVSQGKDWTYIYIGKLTDRDCWFPKPHS